MRIHLDHNAGAPLRPEARDAIRALLDGPPLGNPSSAHREGARARALVEDARAAVASLVGARPAEIVFTSGATEANNLALRGIVAPGAVVTTAVEHASVLETARATGREVRVVPVDPDGHVCVEHVVDACADDAAVVSVGLANGETGVVAPVASVAAAVRRAGAPAASAGPRRFAASTSAAGTPPRRLGPAAPRSGDDTVPLVHTDAAQAVGRIAVDVAALGVDLLSLSSAKIGGPAGVGALWVRSTVRLTAIASGGGQERGRRAGSENVVGIVAFGAAAAAAARQLEEAATRMATLTERLWQRVRDAVPDVVRHGGEPRLPNTLSVRFPGCAGESLLVLLDLAGVACSLGSACAAGAAAPSHVLRAMGLDEEAARSALRVSLGPSTTAEEVDHVAGLLPRLVRQVRAGRAA